MKQVRNLVPGETIEIQGAKYVILQIDTNAFGFPILRLRSEDLPLPVHVTLIFSEEDIKSTLSELEIW